MKTSERRTELRVWQFMLDQTDQGEHFGFQNREYDHSRWVEKEAYQAWETYDDALHDYEGIGWYYTTVRTPADGKRFVLHFDGVGGSARVFINGREAGGTWDRYLPFEVDGTDYIVPGEDAAVAVKVDNSWQGVEHLTGGKNVEWVLYGGLTHHIYAEEREPVRIAHLCIRAKCDGTLKAESTVENLSGRAFTGNVALELPGETLTAKISCRAGKTVAATFETKSKGIEPWSPEHPNLYTCKATLTQRKTVLHTVTERYGYRTIEVRGTEFYLNGKKLRLVGANRYDEFAPYGNCAPADKIREDLTEMKRFGMNIIRTHYPQDPIHYEIADEIGIMYMIEIPLNWWRPNKSVAEVEVMEGADPEAYGTEEFTARSRMIVVEARDMLERTWLNLCNHPCWTVWSLGNECFQSEPFTEQTFHSLAARMRELDCGRLITVAVNRPIRSSHELDFCDFLSLNYYHGVMGGETAEKRDELIQTKMRARFAEAVKYYGDRPHVMTEFGSPCLAGLRGCDVHGRFTEDFSSAWLKAAYAEFLRDTCLRGMIMWCWADYRHHRGFISHTMGIASTFGAYGLKTMDRHTKTLYHDTLKSIYDDFSAKTK